MATVLITGANRGIGLALCQGYAQRGDRVVATCRRPSEALQGLEGVTLQAGVDVSDPSSIARLVGEIGGETIDTVINNAGIMTSESLDDLDIDRIRRQFEVNSLGPLRVTAALLPKLSAGAKLALITSRMGSIADNTSGSRYGYRMSKAALNMAGVSLAHDLRPRGIAVAILHPGFVRTGMTGNSGQIDPSDAARGIMARIDELTLETSGTFWHQNAEVLPW